MNALNILKNKPKRTKTPWIRLQYLSVQLWSIRKKVLGETKRVINTFLIYSITIILHFKGVKERA